MLLGYAALSAIPLGPLCFEEDEDAIYTETGRAQAPPDAIKKGKTVALAPLWDDALANRTREYLGAIRGSDDFPVETAERLADEVKATNFALYQAQGWADAVDDLKARREKSRKPGSLARW